MQRRGAWRPQLPPGNATVSGAADSKNAPRRCVTPTPAMTGGARPNSAPRCNAGLHPCCCAHVQILRLRCLRSHKACHCAPAPPRAVPVTAHHGVTSPARRPSHCQAPDITHQPHAPPLCRCCRLLRPARNAPARGAARWQQLGLGMQPLLLPPPVGTPARAAQMRPAPCPACQAPAGSRHPHGSWQRLLQPVPAALRACTADRPPLPCLVAQLPHRQRHAPSSSPAAALQRPLPD